MQVQVYQHPNYVEVSPDVHVKSDTITKIIKNKNTENQTCYQSFTNGGIVYTTCEHHKNYDNFMKFFNNRVHPAQYYP